MVLLTIETVKIKDYLFSTNKLKVIRGASYLLDYINQVLVVEILKKHGITEDNENYLYVAAGNAKVLVKDKNEADKIIKEVEEAYKKIAPGAKIAASTVENKENKKIWDLIKESTDETANVKNKGFKELNYHLPFVKKCDLCTTNPAEINENNIKKKTIDFLDYLNKFQNEIDKKVLTKFSLELIDKIYRNLVPKNEEKTQGICLECLSKIIFSEEIKEDNPKVGFYSLFKGKKIEKNTDEKEEENKLDFFKDREQGETIEAYKDGKSFVGFMYADGDGLGDFLSKLKDKFVENNNEADYKAFLKEFSVKLDAVTKDSLIEAMKELKHKFPIHKKENGEERRYYGEFLIVGGDDVCGVFPADLVLELSEKYQAIFEREMYKFFEDNRDQNSKDINNITTSSGVLIAKAKTPMYLLFNQSLKLQKSAKKARYNKFKDKKEEKKHGYTDFQVIGSEGNVDIMDFRTTQKLNNLMQRPYEVADDTATETYSDLKKLIEKIQNFKKENFPRNKLRKFYELKKEINKTEALYEFVNLYSKLTKEQKKLLDIKIEENMNLESSLKNIFDILEMYSFVQEKGGKNDN